MYLQRYYRKVALWIGKRRIDNRLENPPRRKQTITMYDEMMKQARVSKTVESLVADIDGK